MRLLPARRLANGSLFEIGLLILVIAGAVALRLYNLDAFSFWVDEAESSINALTILQHGYPTDTYQGLPIFENTLIQPWPDNPEYEFRDISYSQRGVAVYHAWLPLYAIAASFAISKVKPQELDPAPSIKVDLNQRKRITRAARMPAVIFGAIFLIVIFVGADLMYGRDAAWTGLILGAIHPHTIQISQQARYYSAQLLWTTVCFILVWTMMRRGRWLHFVLAGVAFVLLFHTHLLSFVTAVAVFALTMPLIFKAQKQALAKTALFGLIVAAGTLPWLILTGFLTHQSSIPRAWLLLRLPADFLAFPVFQPDSLIAGAVLAAAGAYALLTGRHAAWRARRPLIEAARPLALAAVWIMSGYVAFLALIPAASVAASRLNLNYWGPALIAASIVCAATARVITLRQPTLAAVAIGLALFALTGHLDEFGRPIDTWKQDAQVIDQIAAMQLPAGTKFFAAPNSHLVWTIYTGLPVQSIAPVRKQFLNGYHGDIVYIDSYIESPDWNTLTREQVKAAALHDGYRLSADSVEQWFGLLQSRQYREAMLHSLGGQETTLESLPPFAKRLVNAGAQKAQESFGQGTLKVLMRGFRIDNWLDWRAVFTYRFVNPDGRRGVRSNYAERLRGAEAIILTGAKEVIYRSRWQLGPRPEGIEFRFIPDTLCAECRGPSRELIGEMAGGGKP